MSKRRTVNLYQTDEIKFKQFLALLDAPPTPNKKLNALLKTKSPWEQIELLINCICLKDSSDLLIDVY